MWIFNAAIVLSCIILACKAAPQEDEIINLPGLSEPINFKHYSGYLKASETRQLHYVFVQSQSDPAKDPLVLWLNGGPGCSSMDGLLNEHGPYLVNSKGGLTINPYSWNKIANVLYLEAPAGVGYSFDTTGNLTVDDNLVATQNHVALQNFFVKYPEFHGREFYITGESYGGIYVPTLAAQVSWDHTINLKGIMVGNGLSDYDINDDSLVYFVNYHGLLGDALWEELLNSCCPNQSRQQRCRFSKNKEEKLCSIAIAKAQQIVSYGLNIYNLYSPCYGGVTPQPALHRLPTDLGHNLPRLLMTLMAEKREFTANDFTYFDFAGNLFHNNSYAKIQRKMRKTLKQVMRVDEDILPCTNATAITSYLNSADVRKALHIPSTLPQWAICSADINTHYIRTYNNMEKFYRLLIAQKKYRIMVYNGDIDMACNFIGDQWFIDGLQLSETELRRAWLFSPADSPKQKQIGGYVHTFREGVSLVTIRGAGHMVPQDKPVPAFHMFKSFINSQPL